MHTALVCVHLASWMWVCDVRVATMSGTSWEVFWYLFKLGKFFLIHSSIGHVSCCMETKTVQIYLQKDAAQSCDLNVCYVSTIYLFIFDYFWQTTITMRKFNQMFAVLICLGATWNGHETTLNHVNGNRPESHLTIKCRQTGQEILDKEGLA